MILKADATVGGEGCDGALRRGRRCLGLLRGQKWGSCAAAKSSLLSYNASVRASCLVCPGPVSEQVRAGLGV